MVLGSSESDEDDADAVADMNTQDATFLNIFSSNTHMTQCNTKEFKEEIKQCRAKLLDYMKQNLNS